MTTSAQRGRRRGVRPTGDDRERAILATAERLFAQQSLTAVSVDDLAKGAGISRSAFYFYFRSKDAVLLTLLDQLMGEVESALNRVTKHHMTGDRYVDWRTSLEVFIATFGSPLGVTVGDWTLKSSNPEARAMWSTFMEKWISYTASRIDTERTRGIAPVTLPTHELATALNLMNEQILFAAFAGQRPSVPRERVLDTLTHIWVTSIYGQAP